LLEAFCKTELANSVLQLNNVMMPVGPAAISQIKARMEAIHPVMNVFAMILFKLTNKK
jgi:hypothetical protein